MRKPETESNYFIKQEQQKVCGCIKEKRISMVSSTKKREKELFTQFGFKKNEFETRSKKSSLASGNRPGEKLFYHLSARISQMCMRIYIFCFKKTHRNNKKISTSKIIRTNLHFFPFKK